MSELRPYPSYQSSELSWRASIPSHWQVTRPKTLFQKMERPVRPQDNVVTCFRDGVVTLRKNRRVSGFTESIKEIGYQGIRKGDLIIHAMDAFAGAIGVSDSDGKGTPVYAVCQPKPGVSAYYYALILREMSQTGYLLALAKGIRERSTDFRYSDFADEFVPVPSSAEQEVIVRFIRHFDHRANKLIKAKRTLIALLNEQKQAIIQQAVTRGLDPTVPLKPSGVEWLGDIPQHWDVRRLKFVSSRIVDCLHATPNYLDSGIYPAIRTADISPGIVHVSKAKKITLEDYSRWIERIEPAEGDILYSREGERFGIAACVPADVKLCISQRMMLFRVAEDYCADFVMNLLNSQSTYRQALQDVTGATAPHLNISTIRNYFLALPSTKHEQEMIVLHIKSQTSSISVAISRLEHEIEMLREYRTRLVSDVVTGQLDVRRLDLPDLDDVSLDLSGSIEDGDEVDGAETGGDLANGEGGEDEV